MAFFHGDIYSYALDKMTPLNVYLPCDDNRRFLVDRPQKTLILLHGLEGNSSYWGRYTSVERYAQQYNLALIMPEAEMSMYSNMRCGQNYASYIGEELPEILRNMFKLNLDRDSLSIAGLSMGGYGALRMGLSHPQTFGKCASFSGALMLGSREYMEKMKSYKDPGRKGGYVEEEEIERSLYHGSLAAYGEDFAYRPEDDLLYLAEVAVKERLELPKMLLTCGTEDFLLEPNRIYSQKLDDMGIKHRFETWPGVHNWQFWEECIRDYIGFFADDENI